MELTEKLGCQMPRFSGPTVVTYCWISAILLLPLAREERDIKALPVTHVLNVGAWKEGTAFGIGFGGGAEPVHA